MKNKILIIIALFIAASIYSCDDEFLVKEPVNDITTATFYQTEEDAHAAIFAAYDPLQWYGLYMNNMWAIGDIRSDDAIKGDGPPSDGIEWHQLDNFSVLPANFLLFEGWRACYAGVSRCNIVIEKVPEMDIDNDAKEQVLGEAHFLRGLYYWNLIKVFGDVPLFEENLSFDDAVTISRSPVSEVKKLILSDFTYASAQGRLPNTYPSAELGRVTHGAALGMLSKFYLYEKQWGLAAETAKKVIDLGVYELETNYADNFNNDGMLNENGIESIFEVQFMSNGPNGSEWRHYNSEGNITHVAMAPRGSGIAGMEGWGFCQPTQDLVDSYEDGDVRLPATVVQPGDEVGGSIMTSVAEAGVNAWSEYDKLNRKYLIDDPAFVNKGNDCPLNIKVMRYAEIYLIYAEALNEANNGPTADAYTYLNLIRQRAGLADVDISKYTNETTEQDKFRAAVYHERRIELAMEGDRWFDLVRTGRAIEVMTVHGKTLSERDLLLPLPTAELDINPNLTQNPGY